MSSVRLLLCFALLLCVDSRLFPTRTGLKSGPNAQAAKEILELKASGNTSKAYSFAGGFTGTAGYAVVNENYGSALFYWQVNKLGVDIETVGDTTPVIVWLEGGPGCSSTGSVLFENGPWYYDTASGDLEARSQTWAMDYHMLYIDAPTGAGYSFIGPGDSLITSSEQYAEQVYTALQVIASQHPQWLVLSRPLYLFGESYAGHWIPSLGYYIIKQNELVAETGNIYLPLAGAGIGNAWVDPINQISGYSDFGFALGLFNRQQKNNISSYEQQALSYINTADFESATHVVFQNILPYTKYFSGQTSTSCGINIYNYRNYCDFDFNYTAWTDVTANKALLGIPESVVFNDCSQDVFDSMLTDISTSVVAKLAFLLENTRVMLYTGADDYIVNIVLGEQWLAKMEWPGLQEYLNAPKYNWTVGGEVAGFVREYGTLTQLTVLKAGHLLPHDQAAVSRALATAFISGNWFDG